MVVAVLAALHGIHFGRRRLLDIFLLAVFTALALVSHASTRAMTAVTLCAIGEIIGLLRKGGIGMGVLCLLDCAEWTSQRDLNNIRWQILIIPPVRTTSRFRAFTDCFVWPSLLTKNRVGNSVSSHAGKDLAISSLLNCIGICLVGVAEVTLMEPFALQTGMFFISGLMCGRAVRDSRMRRRRYR